MYPGPSNIDRRCPRRLLSIGVLILTAFSLGCAYDHARDIAAYRAVSALPGDDLRIQPGQPLTLQQALLLANAHNERLAVTGENFIQALAAKHRAGSAFWPTLDLSSTYDFNQATPAKGSHQLDVAASADLSLFRGFRDVAALNQAAATVIQRRELLRDAQQTLLLDVARIYYTVLGAERAVDVLSQSLALQETRVRDMEARQQVGLARLLDVAQTQAQASATRLQLISARNLVTNSRTALALVTAADVAACPLTDGYTPPTPLPEPDTLQALAAQERRDLRAADAAVEAARHAVANAFGQYYPSITLNFDYFILHDPAGDPAWAGAVQGNLPIFRGGQIEADIRAAWSAYRQTELQRRYLARQIHSEIAAAWEDCQTSQRRLTELAVQRSAAELAYKQAEASYNVGSATNLERLTAQDSLLTAELELARQTFAHKLAFLTLRRATGQPPEVTPPPELSPESPSPPKPGPSGPDSSPAPGSGAGRGQDEGVLFSHPPRGEVGRGDKRDDGVFSAPPPTP